MCYNTCMQKLFSFPNGLKLVYVPNNAVRSVALGVFVGAGVVSEEPKQAGISHFIEHMLFKGTATRSSFDIVNELDGIGAQINAFTAKSYTCYHTVSLDTHIGKCAEILSDIFFNSSFKGEELERERRVVIEEINESEDTPDDVCLENLAAVFYKGHRLENPILGTKKSLKGMDGEMLKAYVEKHYTASNTVIAIAGNVGEQEAVALTKKYFECNFRTSSGDEDKISEAEVRCGYAKKKKNIEQAHIAFSFKSVDFDNEKTVAVQLLASIFGTEMSSRLFQSVREKLGLCYTVVGYPSAYMNNGTFIIYTSTNPESAIKATVAIREEILKLLDNGISEEELKKGKEQLKTSQVLGQESTQSMMRAFGRYAIQTGKLYDFDERIKQIDAVTADDILQVAKYIFDFDKVACSLVAKETSIDLLKAIQGKI